MIQICHCHLLFGQQVARENTKELSPWRSHVQTTPRAFAGDLGDGVNADDPGETGPRGDDVPGDAPPGGDPSVDPVPEIQDITGEVQDTEIDGTDPRDEVPFRESGERI